MNRVYIVLEENYNFLANEIGASYIYGCFDTKDKAIKKAIETIRHSVEENECVIDEDIVEEYNNNKEDFFNKYSYVRIFCEKQENWNFYSELSIKELEVK